MVVSIDREMPSSLISTDLLREGFTLSNLRQLSEESLKLIFQCSIIGVIFWDGGTSIYSLTLRVQNPFTASLLQKQPSPIGIKEPVFLSFAFLLVSTSKSLLFPSLLIHFTFPSVSPLMFPTKPTILNSRFYLSSFTSCGDSRPLIYADGHTACL